MIRYILKYFFTIVITILVIFANKQIYNFIITYHIIVYIVLVFLPLTTLAKKSFTVPFLIFIQFFWAALSLVIISLLPVYKVIISIKVVLLCLSSLLVC